MKKGVNIIAILAIVLAVIAVGVVLFLFLRKPATPDDTKVSKQDALGYSALHLETIEQFSEFAEQGKYECHLGNDRSGGSIYNVPVLGRYAVITYYFDEQGNTKDFEAFYYLNADIVDLDNINTYEVSTEELAEICRETISNFCTMFDCDTDAAVYLSNEDGTFTLVENAASFQGLIDGTSYLQFSIRDQAGFYWELNVYANEGLISANLRKYFNVEETLEYVANISLYEEE